MTNDYFHWYVSDEVRMTKYFKWYVSEHVTGCLPDMQVSAFRTKAEASDCALRLKRELQEMGYTVRGTKRDGYTATRHEGDLGRVIEIYTID